MLRASHSRGFELRGGVVLLGCAAMLGACVAWSLSSYQNAMQPQSSARAGGTPAPELPNVAVPEAPYGDEVSEEELRDRARRVKRGLDDQAERVKSFRRELPHIMAGDDIESSIRERLEAHGVAGLSVTIECRSRSCRVELEGARSREIASVHQALSELDGTRNVYLTPTGDIQAFITHDSPTLSDAGLPAP